MRAFFARVACEYKNDAKRVKISRATELNSLGFLSYAESTKGEVKTSLIKESRFTLTNERRVLTNDSHYERTTRTNERLTLRTREYEIFIVVIDVEKKTKAGVVFSSC